MCLNFALVLFPITFINYVSAEIPDYIKVCHETDPNITHCIFNSIAHLRPRMKTGIPELNVPSLEPMVMDDIYLKNGPKSAGIEANLTDIKVFGISNFELQQLSVNLKELKFLFKAKVSSLHFVGNYSLSMQFLFLNIYGEGIIKGNFTDYGFIGSLKGNKVKKGGEEYMQFGQVKIKISSGKVRVHLDNLFKNNDKTLADAANAMINENSDILLDAVKPSLENGIALQSADMANKITSSFPYKELFPK